MKDAKGHGSNTGTKGMRLVKTHVLGPHSAKVYKNPEWSENVVKFFHNGQYQPKADYHTDDMADAHGTAGVALKRYADQDAKASLASGPKSAPTPTHDAMVGPIGSLGRGQNVTTPASRGPAPFYDKPFDDPPTTGKSYNEHGSRHGYNPQSTNDAIAAQNRSGRGKIGGREAKMIHALLKGR